MIKLIKWQVLEYRSPVFSVMLGLLLFAAVAAWLSYTLLQLPLDTVVAIFRIVQWLIFLGIILTRYSDMEISRATRDAGTLALHVPLPQWWVLVAKVLGLVPLLSGYIAINALMFYLMPHDLPQLAELSAQHAAFRAAGPVFWSAVIINALIVRTLLAGVLLPSWTTRFLQQYPKLRAGVSSGLHFMANFALMLPYLIPASIFLAELLDSGLPVTLLAFIVAAVGLLLTFANGYLLEHYLPQIEPWV